MKFGDVPLNTQVGAEFYVQTYVNTTLWSLNAEHGIAVGSFTMPFAGDAVASGWGKFHWSGNDCLITLRFYGATDSIQNVWESGIPGSSFTNIVDIPTFGYWQNLVAGQTVNMVAGVTPQVMLPYFQWFLALVRCYRT